MQPAGSQVGTANIGGATWEVWAANIGWNYIAYRRNGLTSVNLNLKDFIDDSVARGYIQPTWFLHVLEAGTELMSGGAGFSSNSFSFTVNGGGSPTATPTRTPTVAGPTRTPTRTATRTPTLAGPTRTATRTSTPAGPTATRTRTPIGPTATRTNTPAVAGGCAVTYTVNDWNNGGGFTGSIIIRNNSSTPINGWTLAWTFANQRFDHGWEANITQPGGPGTAVTAANLGHNASIGAGGGTRSFGFNATYFGSNPRPATFTLNGTACTVQ
jgi:hypothetical protein